MLEIPDKGRLLCATPPRRMSRQPFRLALNGRDFVSSNIGPGLQPDAIQPATFRAQACGPTGCSLRPDRLQPL
mgnify:CR=1 FL=1